MAQKYGIYLLADDYKAVQNLDTFKIKIKKWQPEKCSCRLCKVYIDRLGFFNKNKPDFFLKNQHKYMQEVLITEMQLADDGWRIFLD